MRGGGDDVVRQFRSDRLRDLRKKLNLSQVELGNLINSSLSTVSRWEIGERTPGGEDLTKLAQTLGTTSAYLMGETDDSGLSRLLCSSKMNDSGAAGSVRDARHATQNTIIITVGDIRMEFPGDASSDLIARVIESVQKK
jgi:transcriptional regulator with XRE-family HTH domain